MRRKFQPGIVALTVGVLSLLGIMLLALRGREMLGGWLNPTMPIVLKESAQDQESAHFRHCRGPSTPSCVVDGDTIWYRGVKIRIADINAPEESEPHCDYELDLGEKAEARLTQLLNQGRFSLEPLPDRDEDIYGRKLRTITRGGHSLGQVLVAEGLAERWVGYRRDWCN